jgi:archaellum component FlaC
MQTTENESQTDDSEHEQLIQVNNKLEHALQTFKDKIDQVGIDRPDLFDGIGEEVDERLRHLISTVENQATQINILHAERDQVEEQLQSEIKQLQR